MIYKVIQYLYQLMLIFFIAKPTKSCHRHLTTSSLFNQNRNLDWF